MSLSTSSPIRAFRVGSAGVLVAGMLTAASVALAPAALAAAKCGPGDTVPPQVTSVKFSPHSVNVRTGAKKISVTVKAKDFGVLGGAAASGIRPSASVFVTFQSPTGSDFRSAFANGFLTRTGGTATNGTWTGKITIPRWTIPGTWKLTNVSATDRKGNSQNYSANTFSPTPTGPTDIALQNGWDKTLTVTATQDKTPPVLKGFTFTPTSVNTKSTTKKVTVTAKVNDSQSGVGSVFASFTAPKAQGGFFHGTSAVLTHRTSNIYKGTAIVQKYQWSAKWNATVSMSDKANPLNSTFVTTKQLAAKHFRHVLTVTSGKDTSKPTLKSFKLNVGSVNTTSTAKHVTFTAKVSDSGSGVNFVTGSFQAPSNKRPSVPSSVGGFSSKPKNGLWKGTFTVPTCITSGVWKGTVSVFDKAGNSHTYTTANLISHHFAHQLKVTSSSPDRTSPSFTTSSGSVSTTSVTTAFSKPVHNVSSNTLTLYSTSNYGTPVHVTAVACKNSGGATVSCATGAVKTATLTVPSLSSGSYQLYANLRSVRAQLKDAAGHPVSWTFGTFLFAS